MIPAATCALRYCPLLSPAGIQHPTGGGPEAVYTAEASKPSYGAPYLPTVPPLEAWIFQKTQQQEECNPKEVLQSTEVLAPARESAETPLRSAAV